MNETLERELEILLNLFNSMRASNKVTLQEYSEIDLQNMVAFCNGREVAYKHAVSMLSETISLLKELS